VLRSNIKIDLELKGKAQPNAQLKEAIYRITQEAINNSIKHSQAKNIKIEVSFIKNETALIASDDGIGFDDDDVSKKNLGLYIMHERAKALGASLDVSSTKDKGTKISFNYKDKKR